MSSRLSNSDVPQNNVYEWLIILLVSIYLILVAFYLVVTGRARVATWKGVCRRIRRWFHPERRPFPITGVIADWIQTDCLPAVRLPVVDSPIVVLTHSLPAGGAERQWCYLAVGLKERGQNVAFVSINELLGPDAHYLPLLEREKVSVVELAKLPPPNVWNDHTIPPHIRNALLSGGCAIATADLLRLTKLFQSLRPRAVIAQLDYPNLLAAMAALIAGVPRTILSFRNYNPSNFSYLRNDWYQKYYQTVASSKRIILTGNTRDANSDYAKWIGIPPEQVHWIPNSIDPTCIETAAPEVQEKLRQTLGIASGQPVILGVFRLSEEKRPLLFLEVCARIVKQCTNVRFLIAGTGPMEQEMKDRIHALGLNTVVTLLGRRDDISVIMSWASLLLLTSSFEGMPNAVMEAQLLGLPVVGPYVGGMPDCVEDGRTGFLVRDDNTEEMANACIAILKSPDMKRTMGEAAAQRMKSRFTRDAMISSYLELVYTAAENESHSSVMACTDKCPSQ
jgi:glycosyltransferase involved in cell wall biosynthesis